MVTNRQSGFILVTTIWMIALLAVLAAVFHSYIERQVVQASALKKRIQNEIDIESTATSVRYLLATRRTTVAGLTLDMSQQKGFITPDGVADVSAVGGEIRLDDTAYRGIGNVQFSIQDQAGLLSINSPSTPRILLEVLRAQMDTQRARELTAALADYIDGNSIKRLNGAESADYRGTGLPGPSNWFLRTEMELENVLGWQQLLRGENGALWRNGLAITHANVLNVNTAPALLLEWLLDLDPGQGQLLVDARREYPFRSLSGVADVLGDVNSWEETRYRFYSSDRLRLTFWCDECGYSIVQSLELTPDGYYGPWLMDYSYVGRLERGVLDNEPASLVSGAIFADSLLVDR